MSQRTDQFAVLLFLDFDGVLHPTHKVGHDNFCCLPLFETVLREFPDVGIVIASSWRHHVTYAEIVSLFADDLQARIIGMTRHVDVSGARNRYEEINDYLHYYDERRPYLVLDDSRFEFPRDYAPALFCNANVGFDAHSAEQLSQRIRALLH